MVEFCTVCGTSLPKGDLSFRGGKIFTSPDYDCPSCGQAANPMQEEKAATQEPAADKDLIIKQGEVKGE